MGHPHVGGEWSYYLGELTVVSLVRQCWFTMQWYVEYWRWWSHTTFIQARAHTRIQSLRVIKWENDRTDSLPGLEFHHLTIEKGIPIKSLHGLEPHHPHNVKIICTPEARKTTTKNVLVNITKRKKHPFCTAHFYIFICLFFKYPNTPSTHSKTQWAIFLFPVLTEKCTATFCQFFWFGSKPKKFISL